MDGQGVAKILIERLSLADCEGADVISCMPLLLLMLSAVTIGSFDDGPRFLFGRWFDSLLLHLHTVLFHKFE